MKKVLSLLFLGLTALSATAQEYVTAWHNDGSAEVIQLTAIDSLTFTMPQGAITLTTGTPAVITANSMTTYCSATAVTPVTGAGTERGVCYSQNSPLPTTDNYRVADGPAANGIWQATLTGLSDGKTCYYRAYAIVGDQTYYGAVRSFTVGSSVQTVTGPSTDLGLSVEWGTTNLTSTASSGGTSTGKGLGSVGISAKQAYTITTARGGWYADTQFKSTSDAKTNANNADAHQQFAFVPNPDDSTVVYLYSISQQRFVKKNRSLTTSNPDRIYIFRDTNDDTYPFFFSFSADKKSSNINIGGAKQMVVDGWGTYDDGNKCKLTAIDNAAYDLSTAQELLCSGEPTSTGGYFAWGETGTKDKYAWNNYRYGNGTKRTKYTSTDNKKTLESADDAATTVLGEGWRLPTVEEFQELKEKCKWVWTTEQNVNGYRIIAANGNSIFLPAAGFTYGTTVFVGGEYGYYLTNGVDSDDADAQAFGFCKDTPAWLHGAARFFGCTIRPVKTK